MLGTPRLCHRLASDVVFGFVASFLASDVLDAGVNAGLMRGCALLPPIRCLGITVCLEVLHEHPHGVIASIHINRLTCDATTELIRNQRQR